MVVLSVYQYTALEQLPHLELIDIVDLLTLILKFVIIHQLNNQGNQCGLQSVKIDLDLIPASDAELHEKIADLQQAEVYNLQGEANLGKNLVKQAIRDFNHALEINPDYVDALVNRGSAYVLKNNYNDALADLNHALDLEKKQAEKNKAAKKAVAKKTTTKKARGDRA